LGKIVCFRRRNTKGIGTTSPGYKLDVNGTLHAGNSYFDTVYIGGSTSRGLRSVSGNYGTVQTTGGGAGNWEGYSIDGRYVFMSADNNNCGIYNDLDNEWMIYCARNSWTRLYYNGAQKLETTNTGVTITGTVTATTFSGNATSATNADTVDNLHASSFLRSDTSDTVGAGVTYSWGATNTHGLSFKNSSYNTYLYIGGWTSTNSDNISRIRNSSGNLHIDSAANGNLYLNWYTSGSIEINSTLNSSGYIYANSGARINRLQPYSSSYGSGYSTSAIEVREYNLEGATGGTEWARAPRIGFHWSGRVASQIMMDSGGTIMAVDNPGTGYANFNAAQVYASTAFYTDGNRSVIRGGSPTLYFRDTDQMSAMIHNNGNLLYILRGGTDTESWTQVNGQWPWYFNLSNNDSTCGGSLYCVGNVTAYSDIRHKKDIVKLDNALEKVEKLNGYTYTRINDGKRYTGLIAQEVLEVLPEAVIADEKGDYSLAYGNMAGLFVEAMKDMKSKLDDALARLSALENTLS
jgi:hypothetical protein